MRHPHSPFPFPLIPSRQLDEIPLLVLGNKNDVDGHLDAGMPLRGYRSVCSYDLARLPLLQTVARSLLLLLLLLLRSDHGAGVIVAVVC